MIKEVMDNSKYNSYTKSKRNLSIIVIILLLVTAMVIYGHKQNSLSLIDVHDKMVERTGITEFREEINSARLRTKYIFIGELSIILILAIYGIWASGSRNYYYKRQKFLEHQIEEEQNNGGVCTDFNLKIQRLEEDFNNGNRKQR